MNRGFISLIWESPISRIRGIIVVRSGCWSYEYIPSGLQVRSYRSSGGATGATGAVAGLCVLLWDLVWSRLDDLVFGLAALACK